MLPLWKCCQRPIASFNDGGGKLDIGCWLLDIGYLYIRLIVFWDRQVLQWQSFWLASNGMGAWSGLRRACI